VRARVINLMEAFYLRLVYMMTLGGGCSKENYNNQVRSEQ